MPELIWAPFSSNKWALLGSVKNIRKKLFALRGGGAAPVFGMGHKHLLLFCQCCTAVEFQMNLRKLRLFLRRLPLIYERWSHVRAVLCTRVCVWWLALVFVIGCIAHYQQSVETTRFHLLDYHLIAFSRCCDICSFVSHLHTHVAIQWNINS